MKLGFSNRIRLLSETISGTIAGATFLSLLTFCQLSFAANLNEKSSSNSVSPSSVSTQPEFRYSEIKSYQQLPELPQMEKAEFMQGVMYPSAKGGCATTYNLAAHETEDQVLRWYHNALTTNKWSLTKEQSKGTVRARKGVYFVQVLVAPSAHRGYSCDVTITYLTSAKNV